MVHFLVLLLAATCLLNGQTANRPEERLITLSQEIAALKTAIESSRIEQSRLLILLAKVQSQHQLVRSLSKRLENTSDELRRTRTEITKFEEQIQSLNHQARAVGDNERRIELERRAQETQAALSTHKLTEGELKDRFVRAESSLRVATERSQELDRSVEAAESDLVEQSARLRK
jgi:chromosome segregation ATPase